MSLIRIERRGGDDLHAVTVAIGDTDFATSVKAPFNKAQERLLEWYFEEHLRFPFTGGEMAKQVAASIKAYGEQLFAQLFADPKAFAAYSAVKGDVSRVEILGSTGFHALHWEALKDPDLPRAFALDVPMVRASKAPQALRAATAPSPTLNLLVVTARPHGATDVSYRTVTRPLIEALNQASLRVDVDIVRPGTFKALQHRLEDAGAGRYHVVHFDLHGAVLSWDELQCGAEQDQFTFNGRYGRSDLAAFKGKKGFLFFETDKPDAEEKDRADPAEAGEVAALLQRFQVPILILNACQSGKQAESEASLAARLLEAGAETVLGMGYSVTVSAASLMMPELYRNLFEGKPLDEAIRRGRRLLHDNKTRRAYFRQQIDLEDWLLPVVHQHRPTELKLREFTQTERQAWLKVQAISHKGQQPSYGFFGRDLDILRIEKRLLAHASNILLIHGMGGTGKTSLLHHLGSWWQKTGFIDEVFYLGYDEKAYTRQQIMHAMAERLYDPGRYHGSFLTMGEELQQADLAETLRAKRHLMILDNLESVTGSPLSIPNTLEAKEQEKLKSFLAALKGGKSLVLLGSRGKENRLAETTFGGSRYELGGLDPEAASDLADAVLARHGATKWRRDKDFAELLKLLSGYPLPIEVLLPSLARQTPTDILAALRGGDEAVDLKKEGKTESLLRCIDYSHGNLSPEAQDLLLCLAPFTGIINAGMLKGYSKALREEPELAGLTFERWPEVLQEAINWGLLSGDAASQGLLRIQPIFPYFLRARLNDPSKAGRKTAIERGFRRLYDGIGGSLGQLMQSKEPAEQQTGFGWTGLEYANLAEALRLGLQQQVAILNLYRPLSFHYDRTQDQERGLVLGEMVLQALGAYPEEAMQGQSGLEFIAVIDTIAKRYLLLKRHADAKRAYQRALDLVDAREQATGVRMFMKADSVSTKADSVEASWRLVHLRVSCSLSRGAACMTDV